MAVEVRAGRTVTVCDVCRLPLEAPEESVSFAPQYGYAPVAHRRCVWVPEDA